MKYLKSILLAGSLLVLTTAIAQAGDIKVVANSSVAASSVSAEDLKSVFLATKTSLSDGSHVEPVLLKSGATHEAFVKEYLGKTDAALETYYRSLVFTGKGSMPKTVGSEADLVEYVAKTKGAIGYVSAGAGTGNAKVIEVK
jgi:hypothetical protein